MTGRQHARRAQGTEMPQRPMGQIKAEIARLEAEVEALQRAARDSVEDSEAFARITREMRASNARIDALHRELRKLAGGDGDGSVT